MQTERLYTEPKLSPFKPEPADISKHWYVWFRFFDVHTGKWIQKRYKKGINEYKSYKERIVEANALKQVIKEDLADGWNPLTNTRNKVIDIYSCNEAVEYILQVKSKTLKIKTKYAYTYITKLLLEWMDKSNLLQLSIKRFSTEHAQRYMDYLVLTKNYSNRTYNDHLIVLRTFFNCFIERSWISDNPFRSVKRQKASIGRNLAFTDLEKQKLEIELYSRNKRLYYFTRFVFHCYIRRTELTYLKVKHIDLHNKTIIIAGDTAKNQCQESVVIPVDMEPVIREMELWRYNSEDYLFGRGLQTGPHRYKNPNRISTIHNDMVKQLGFDQEKGLYSWKHTGVCYYYYATNKDIYAVMRQLRHRELNTTMIYLKSLGLVQNDAFRNARVA